jgi:16S rRNA (cytidine1402-2'-O)-methyltransferase
MSGILYVVATPIGHLGDMSRRGIETLNHVGVIAAEDTRRTRVLLQHIDHAGCELLSVHEHNEEHIAPQLIKRLQQGTDIALVSDAGTPLINDPGYLLLQLAWQAGLRVVPVPGACSITTALSVCPIPCQPFRYVGFLSGKPRLRRSQLEHWLMMPDALVFLESPHRIRAALSDIADLSPRQLMIGREMTKQYESFITGSAKEVLAQLAETPKGEFVCVVEAAESVTNRFDLTHVVTALLQELAPTQAAKLAAQICGVRKKEAYDLALQLSSGQRRNER